VHLSSLLLFIPMHTCTSVQTHSLSSNQECHASVCHAPHAPLGHLLADAVVICAKSSHCSITYILRCSRTSPLHTEHPLLLNPAVSILFWKQCCWLHTWCLRGAYALLEAMLWLHSWCLCMWELHETMEAVQLLKACKSMCTCVQHP
jgi:hypothetical protein